MKHCALAVLIFLAVGFGNEAGALPLCKEKWKGQRTEFDFKEDYSAYLQRLKREGCEKEWTVLVYMAADNNLFPYALWDLYEMEAAFQSRNVAGSTLKTDVIVQVDGTGKDDLRRLHIYSGPVEYKEKTKEDFAEGKLEDIKSPVISRLSENDGKGEKQRLEDFLLWASEKYPSRNTMVIVWGHGQGWKSFPVETPVKSRFLERTEAPKFPKPATDKNFGGIAFKEGTATWLDIPGLSSALETFRSVRGKKIDVYASDACLMQMLEVSYEISESTRFVVGTTQVQSFLGLPYRRIFYELNTGRFNGLRKDNRPNVDSSDEPYLLAKMMPTLMKASLNPRGHGLQSGPDKEAIKSMTSSALTVGEMEGQLVPAIAGVSKALKAYLQEDSSRVMELRYVTQNVPTFEGSAQDFGIFLGYLDQLLQEERAKNGGTFSPAAQALRDNVILTKEALNRSVLSFAYGSNYGVDANSQLLGYVPRAVSLWLPVSSAEFKKRKDEFQASRLYGATRWQDWLELLFPAR